MKAIMYHYVREFNPEFSNFKYLDVNNFQNQLDFLEKEYGFVDKNDWNNIIHNINTKELPKGVILTFDDAMSCHYEYVFKILKQRKLWGIFFVPTMPYTSNEILDVHKIHLLCGKFDGNKLLKKCIELVDSNSLKFKQNNEFNSLTYSNQSNFEGISQFKRILNYFIDDNIKKDVIDEICNYFKLNLDLNNFYVSEKNLKQMSDEGMVIGSHTVNHPVMSKLDSDTQRKEIIDSFDFLDSIISLSNKVYCHPYGGTHSFNDNTITLLNELNIDYAFSVANRNISLKDFRDNKYALPRYDCNQFSHGKSA